MDDDSGSGGFMFLLILLALMACALVMTASQAVDTLGKMPW